MVIQGIITEWGVSSVLLKWTWHMEALQDKKDLTRRLGRFFVKGQHSKGLGVVASLAV